MDKVSSKISKHTEMCIQQSHIGHCIQAKKNSPVAFRFQCLLRIEDIFPYHQKNKKMFLDIKMFRVLKHVTYLLTSNVQVLFI